MDVMTQLVQAVEAVCSAEVPTSLDELRTQAMLAEQSAQRLRAKASQLLGEVDALDPDEVHHWWRDGLKLTGEAAGHALRRARGLRSLPVVDEATISGELSLEQAGALVPLVGKLDPRSLDEMQPLLVEGAGRRSVESIQQWVRSILAAHAEENLEDEQALAAEKRYWKHRLTPDGMFRGSFAFTAEDGEYVLSVLEPIARRQGDADERTAGQRRADAAVDVFVGALRWMELPAAGGQRAQVSYVMTCAWAAGLREADPARGAWTGPQTRARMEAMLCDARLSRVLLDAEGQVSSLVSVNDQITLAQRRAVSARDRCCVAKGCTRPPAFCDVHHLISREDGGPTVLDN
ncbi:MAG: putative endonuclease, partial [Frankiales bacterium]|nr:putative endonuclease [Frankiales bacterium]